MEDLERADSLAAEIEAGMLRVSGSTAVKIVISASPLEESRTLLNCHESYESEHYWLAISRSSAAWCTPMCNGTLC